MVFINLIASLSNYILESFRLDLFYIMRKILKIFVDIFFKYLVLAYAIVSLKRMLYMKFYDLQERKRINWKIFDIPVVNIILLKIFHLNWNNNTYIDLSNDLSE